MDELESKPILFPTDFDFHSEAAFSHAVHLAAENNSELILLHVCNVPDMPYSGTAGQSYHESLRARLSELDSDLVAIERMLTVADPGPEICRVAAERNCGTIFMGITNRHDSDECACSTYEYVHQNAPCHVVTFCDLPDSFCFSKQFAEE